MTTPYATAKDRTESANDVVAPSSVAALAATLDYDTPPGKGTLPLLWHWIFFRPTARQSLLGEDGHPLKGNFLPDLGLPRRMWAGGRLRFPSAVRIGDAIERQSRIVKVEEKSGRSGKLGFVTVSHRVTSGGVVAIEEEQDIVFREPAQPGTPSPAPAAASTTSLWHRTIVPDEPLLFRYSALIFFAHRIHYDKPYTTGVEGYPNLVVHGPLIATLLMDLLRRAQPDAHVLEFSFKALRPSFAGNTLNLRAQPSEDGKTVELWSHDHEGWLTMSARATLA
ncbi:acyl-CoA dehydrogenase [Burkholderia sp. SFA1]|uniref:FAS1-like dehydratase domain-containing protein n=1 Tax=Caballeronia sp. CLC5 TaxID=2906764 RepID=UPI001F25245A|nr:MaoC family dehydratase N-terminal domain-containing protein [Caballeronia sp. CLC5]MCE4574629.1 MaoC family dehydratase N-terminal domain-containing protein [Caballeronia sp. CLC5]BBQ00013.1 acyl-CoA dehydrogenase [Burkholderia sp. SFA1]